MLDKQKYIEETKETMDQNSRKLAEITKNINDIHGGKATVTMATYRTSRMKLPRLQYLVLCNLLFIIKGG